METTLNDKIKNVLTTEVKFIIAILVFSFGVVSPYFQMKQNIALMQQDIANINANHEVHIQDLTQAIKDIQVDQKMQNDQIIELQKTIIKISR